MPGAPLMPKSAGAANRPTAPPPSASISQTWRHRSIVAFGVALAALLTGYMFLGRGFAHVGVGPIYIGELVLVLAGVALLLARPVIRLHWLHVVLIAFMVWGAIRTVPYLDRYGMDALREGTLWGYGFFAIAVSLLATLPALAWARDRYRWMGVAFVFWAPVAWWVFGTYGDQLPKPPGSDLPLLFVKNSDVAVHLTGVAAMIVLGGVALRRRWFLSDLIVALPMVFGLYLTGSVSRGAMAAAGSGFTSLFVVRPKSRHWLGILLAVAIVGFVVIADPLTPREVAHSPAPPSEGISATAAPSVGPGASDQPSRTPSQTATPAPTPLEAGREPSSDQLLDNLASIFGTSTEEGLEGTKRFRLAWWSKIIDYTFNGPYFWLGKGYGVNLADADGFQVAEGVMRAPHNSHLSVLARSGVPGLGLWLTLQLGFGITLLLAAIRARRARHELLAFTAAWVLVYWTAMMANTSFDPYLEGPQGGIWFWSLFGLGLACIREIDSLRRPHAD